MALKIYMLICMLTKHILKIRIDLNIFKIYETYTLVETNINNIIPIILITVTSFTNIFVTV